MCTRERDIDVTESTRRTRGYHTPDRICSGPGTRDRKFIWQWSTGWSTPAYIGAAPRCRCGSSRCAFHSQFRAVSLLADFLLSEQRARIDRPRTGRRAGLRHGTIYSLSTKKFAEHGGSPTTTPTSPCWSPTRRCGTRRSTGWCAPGRSPRPSCARSTSIPPSCRPCGETARRSCRGYSWDADPRADRYMQVRSGSGSGGSGACVKSNAPSRSLA